MKVNRSRNAEATREAILEAAETCFLDEGYDNAGVRCIAARVGVDPALICRYFGSKKALFKEVLDNVSDDPMKVFEGDRSSCGDRIAAALLNPSAGNARHMAFMKLVLGATSSQEASLMAHEQIEQQFLRPVSAWLGGKEGRQRAWLICSLLMGAVIMNNIQPDRAPTRDSLARQFQEIIAR